MHIATKDKNFDDSHENLPESPTLPHHRDSTPRQKSLGVIESSTALLNSGQPIFTFNKTSSVELDSGEKRLIRQMGASFKRKTKRKWKAQAHLNALTEPTEEFGRLEKEKDPQSLDLIKKALLNHFVFTSLDTSQIDRILGNFFYCKVEQGKYVFKQDDEASCFFIVDQGKLQVNINEQDKSILGPGKPFGELALLYNAPRSASILALEDSFLWGIDGYTFRQMVQEMIIKDISQNKMFIEKVPFFKNLTPEQNESVASILIKEKFMPNDFIVHEGDNADSYYIIQKGSVCIISKEGVEVRVLNEGDTFGEAALLEFNNVRQMSVKAKTEVVCLALGRETLINILGDKVQNIACRNILKWGFEKDPWLSKLTQVQKEKVFENMKNFNVKQGTVVLKKGDRCNKIMVPIDGNLVDHSGNIICEKGNVLGSFYFLMENMDKKMPEDIMTDTEGIYSEIILQDFAFLIGGALQVVIKNNENSHEKQMTRINEDKELDLPLTSLVYLKKIGQGQFGNVYLVEDKQERLYALKTVSKAKVFSLCLEKHIQDERRVLKKLKFPLIMEFFRTYKDETNVYFLTEYIAGMELFDVIREIGLLNKLEAQFYIGSMILAIEYLHTQSIIYRDVKPENVMIDATGYPKLIDMGTCKTLGKPGFRTFTIIGTPTYMAPEVVSGKGYSFTVDYWSIGICLYEFMCGFVPFGENSDDPYEIYNEILTKRLDFPAYMKDNEAKKLMQQLLNRMPEVRGNGAIAAIKAHSWFNNFNWDKLLEKQIIPPYTPPEDKLISKEEIVIRRNQGHLMVKVLENMKEDISQMGNIPQSSVDWDQEF